MHQLKCVSEVHNNHSCKVRFSYVMILFSLHAQQAVVGEILVRDICITPNRSYTIIDCVRMFVHREKLSGKKDIEHLFFSKLMHFDERNLINNVQSNCECS